MFDKVLEGVGSGAGEFLSFSVMTLLLGGYVFNKSRVSDDRVVKLDEETLRVLKSVSVMSDQHEKFDIESKESGVNWRNIRKLRLVCNGRERMSSVGGLINSVWCMLSDEERVVFLIRSLLNDVSLSISENKVERIIVSHEHIQSWIVDTGNVKSIWGFKKTMFGCEFYFLNNYGYENAPELIRVLKMTLSGVVDLDIQPVLS